MRRFSAGFMALRFAGRLKLSQAMPSFICAVATFGSSAILQPSHRRTINWIAASGTRFRPAEFA